MDQKALVMNIPFLGPREEILVPVDFPPLVKHHPHMLRFSSDKFAPVRGVFLMTKQRGHFLKRFRYFELIHCKATEALPENLLKIAFVAFPQEIQIARMLVNLPCAKDMFGQLTPIGSRVPGGALVVGEHDRPVGGLTVPSVLDQVFPGQNVSIGEARLVASKSRP